MRIGIDARFLTHPQAGGFKTYTENLVRSLGQVDERNEYVVYVDRNPASINLPRHPRFSYCTVDGAFPGFGMPLREQVKLRRQIRRDRPLDTIHFLCNTAPAGLAQNYVVTLHDTIQIEPGPPAGAAPGANSLKRWAISSYSKWTILQAVRSARRVITVSEHEKARIVQLLGIDPQCVCVTHLAPNPVFAPASNVQKRQWRDELRNEHDLPERYVLAVGFEPRKNIPLVIDAFTQLTPDCPDLGLVVVAAEEGQRRHFERPAHERQLSDRSLILGATSPSMLAILYNLATVFVFPSERESFGLPPLEAIACGTATIAMRKTSLPEILQDGALYVDHADADAWARAIGQVVGDDALRKDLSNRGLIQAATFSWTKCASETTAVYQTAVG